MLVFFAFTFFQKKVTKKLWRKDARLPALSHRPTLPQLAGISPIALPPPFRLPPTHCAKFTSITLIQQIAENKELLEGDGQKN